LRHILVRITQSDSESTRIDKLADSLSRQAASSDQGAKFDSASHALKLPIYRVQAIEDETAMLGGRPVPSVSAWAFGGARVGETSELFDDDNGYYLARLDSLRPGGEPRFEDVKDDVRAKLAAEKAVDQLLPAAQKLASAAAASTLESAAQQAGKKVETTPMFARSSFVSGLGQFTPPIGAAFGLPVGAVSQPVKSTTGVFVLRVDKRVLADSTAWAAQKQAQRATRLQQLRQQAVQMFLEDMRKAAKVTDNRKQIQSAMRRQET
jgi:peptidyl-prolyl cis-trans isomerase D